MKEKLAPRFVSVGRTIGAWSTFSLSANSKSASKSAPPVDVPSGQVWPQVLELTGLGVAPGGNSESGAFGQIVIPVPNRATVESLNALGVWVLNRTGTVKEFLLTLYNGTLSATSSGMLAVSSDPHWQFAVIPRQNLVSSGLGNSDVIGAVRISEYASPGRSWGSWTAGDKMYFGNVVLNPRGRATFLLHTDDGYADNIHPISSGNGFPLSGRTYLEVASRYGYGAKICAYIIPDDLGRPGYLTVADLNKMQDYGFIIASHSDKHPQNQDNAGLRLLGPYGYYLSQLQTQGLGSSDCPVTASNGNVLTTSTAHRFLGNMPIQFTNVAPGGLQVGTTYYTIVISGTTFSVSSERNGSPIPTGTWTGTAHYRYVGSAQDDTAIYYDVMSGAQKLADLGFSTALDHFALPQGAWDNHVASAVERCGFKTVRGVSSSTLGHGLPGVMNTGGARYGSSFTNYGWINIPGSIQLDGAGTLDAMKLQIEEFIDGIIALGGVGSCYGHAFGSETARKFDYLCSYLKSKERDGLIDVLDMEKYSSSVFHT